MDLSPERLGDARGFFRPAPRRALLFPLPPRPSPSNVPIQAPDAPCGALRTGEIGPC